MFEKYKPLLVQIFLFGLVGGTTFLIDVSVTWALFHVLHMPAYLASAGGFLSGFVFNFPMNRKKVFRHSADDRYSFRTQIVQYVCLALFNLFATSAVVDFLVVNDLTPIAIAKALVTIVIAIWNFVIFKFIVFSKKKPSDQSELDARVLNDIL